MGADKTKTTKGMAIKPVQKVEKNEKGEKDLLLDVACLARQFRWFESSVIIGGKTMNGGGRKVRWGRVLDVCLREALG